MKPIFLDVASLLEPYYSLVNKVNTFEALTLEDVLPFCSPILAKELINLQKLYMLSGKTRSCGNPSFVHSLRCFIWAQALHLPLRTSRLVLNHDVVEDFGTTYEQLRGMLEKIPVDIRDAIQLLTNHYKIIAQEMSAYQQDILMKKKLVTFYHEDDLVPQKIFNLLGNLPAGIDANSYLKDNSYRLYLEDIIDAEDESLLIAKFIDRLDNTLADLPSKFDVILKLYDKNLLLLTLSTDAVLKTKNHSLQLLYLLLYERFMDQSIALRKRYDFIAKVRGKFYGNQYSKLGRDLRVRHQELEKLHFVMEKLHQSSSLQRYILALTG